MVTEILIFVSMIPERNRFMNVLRCSHACSIVYYVKENGSVTSLYKINNGKIWNTAFIK